MEEKDVVREFYFVYQKGDNDKRERKEGKEKYRENGGNPRRKETL